MQYWLAFLLGALITAVCEVARTWIFPKDEVGIYTFLLAIPLMFIGITSLRYDISIVIEEDDRKSLALVKLSMLLTLLVSAAVTVGFIVYIACFHQKYIPYLYVTPFATMIVLGYGINNILNSVNNRYKEYATISKKYLIRTAIQSIGAVVLGLVFVKVLKMPSLSVAIMMAPYGLGLFAGVKSQAQGLIEKKKN